MTRTAFEKKKPYLDTEDTIEEVGITRRQLNYWREKGLFTPEFGEDAKKFTEKDIKVLKFARRLIVDHDFPVEVAKRLIDAATASLEWWMDDDLDDFQYLDIKSGTLLTTASLESSLWDVFGATAKQGAVERRLYTLALLLFRLVRLTATDGPSFMARRDEILEQIRGLSLAARVHYGSRPWSKEPQFYVDPQLPKESLEPDVAESWLAYHSSQLGGFMKADVSPYLKALNSGRFWDEETLAAAERWKEDQKASMSKGDSKIADVDADNLDDVPF